MVVRGGHKNEVEAVKVGVQAQVQMQPKEWRISVVVISVVILLALVGWAWSRHYFPRYTGVPAVELNYSIGVEDWWATHPLNPNSPGGIPIGGIPSPQPVVNVQSRFGGNTQNALESLPTTGGTLYFPPGQYSPFQIIGRSHIHFISDGGATITGHSSIYPCQESIKYGDFNLKVFNREPAALECFTHPISDFYFKNLTFDGANSANTAVDMAVVQDVVFDGVTFQNYARLNVSYEIGLINADRGSNNVWCRGCHFVGSQRMAVFMDGMHGGGIIDSRFEKDFYAMWLMFGTNDDFTIDTNNDNTYDLTEQRTSQYLVVANNTFVGPIYEAMNVNGMQTLVENNRVIGPLYQDFARYNARCSQRGGGVGLVYLDHDNKVVDNRIETTPLFAKMDQSSGKIACPDENFGRLGKYTVTGNVITAAPKGFQLVSEIGTVDGPNVVDKNCVNDDKCAAALTAQPTPRVH